MLKISRNHRDLSLLRSLWQKQMVRSGIIELPDWSNFLYLALTVGGSQ